MAKLMTSRDLARVSCSSCEGCGECCRGMDDTIHLDPYDLYELEKHLGKSFDELLDVRVALHVEDGLVLPHLLMRGDNIACTFLGPDGRCQIHDFRPGFCRLFPLGRRYEDRSFGYFVVEGACPRPCTKVKISKYLEIPGIGIYERYINTWHYFCRDVQDQLRASGDEEFIQRTALRILEIFFAAPYDTDRPFYPQFEERIAPFI
jgi:Fe-S-cluster containining protein